MPSISVVNRSAATDSKLSLDVCMEPSHFGSMSYSTFWLYCQRIDSTRNMARYYAISVQPTLFGETVVVRSWGRIGSAGREKIDVFNCERDATAHFLEIARRKKIRGYKPVGNCGNLGEETAFAAPRQ